MVQANGPWLERFDNDGERSLRESPPPPQHGFWCKVWQVLKTLQARLRFIAILAVIGLIIGNWSTINNYYEKWTRSGPEVEAAASDLKWYCPMHPYIVRDNRKEKCPICHMDLARLKKGAEKPLPPGTVSRVQLTPYRMVLAGVQTTPVELRALAKEITTFGSVEFDETRQNRIIALQKSKIVKLHVNYTGQWVQKGQPLAVLDIRYSPELTVTLEDLLRARRRWDSEAERISRRRLRLWNIDDDQIKELLRDGTVKTRLTIPAPVTGHVVTKYQREGNIVDEGTPLYDLNDLKTVWVEAQVYEADQGLLHEGQRATATTLALPNRPFPGKLDFVYPHLDESSRTLAVRFQLPNPEHQLRPGMYATVTVEVKPEQLEELGRASSNEWLEETTGEILAHGLLTPAGPAAAPGIRPLLEMAVRQAGLGQGVVSTVPDSAVIDTGRLKIVYREASRSVFEGVAVRLGPRMAERSNPIAFYPVLRGLRLRDKVVTNGSFLIDAETRLNPAAGSIYFGGSGTKAGQATVAVRPSTPEAEDAKEAAVKAELAKLSAADRALANAQKYCPQTKKRLGSMGRPIKITVGGKAVFLCCESCEESAKKDPKQTLAKVEELKAKAKAEADRHE
jgi:Cu(I)/Ag(I) efflux system membrane fusion protein